MSAAAIDPRTALRAWLEYARELGLDSWPRPAGLDEAGGTRAREPGPPRPEVDADAASEPPARRSPPAAMLERLDAVSADLLVSPPADPKDIFNVVPPAKTLEDVRSEIGDCKRCRLHQGRTHLVFGVGNANAELMFVGEGPGHDEDLQGLPFVGRAGQLLTQMIEAMGLSRSDVYIANVVKCRPPENRTPEKDEVSTCMPFLMRQIGAIQPKVIVCLGSCAAQALLSTNKSISRFRGEWFDFRGARLMATYHPAYLLRNPRAKPEVWTDLKKVMAYLGLKPPVRAPRS